MCGDGNPTFPVRRLVSRLAEDVPIYVFTDMHPAGYGIYLTYRYSTRKGVWTYESLSAMNNLYWIGLTTEDLRNLQDTIRDQSS